MADVLRALKHPESQTVEKVPGRQQAGNWAELEASLFWKEQKHTSVRAQALGVHGVFSQPPEKTWLQPEVVFAEAGESVTHFHSFNSGCGVHAQQQGRNVVGWRVRASPFRKAETSLS